MKERFAAVRTPDGVMQSFVTHPEGSGPFPAVILYMDIWGVREELYDVARRIGTAGYYCIVPNLYYRQGNVSYDFRNEKGEVISSSALDPALRREVLEQSERVTNAVAMADTAAILSFFESEPVRPGAVGTLGYCMGGRLTLCAAGTFPESITASAVIHGTTLTGDSKHGSAPLRQAQRFRGEVYCGFAELDRHASPAVISEVAETLKSAPVRYEYRVHAGIDHGYSLPERDVYDRAAANNDWEKIFAMFYRQIPPPPFA